MTKLRAGVVGMALAGSIAMLAGSAAADGMDKPSMKDTHHHTPFTWTGFYGGLGVGYQTNKITGSFANAPGFFWDSGKQSGGIVGVQGGYQYQLGNLVLGVEGAYKSVMSPAFSSKLAGGAGAPCGFVANVQNCEGRMNDIFQVGGRLGFAVQNVLLYGTGGYALGNFETQGLTVANGQPFSSGSRKVWVRGQDTAGNWGPAASLTVQVNGLSSVDAPAVPRVAFLAQNAPNPFGGATSLRYGLHVDGPADLAVYSVQGRLVKRLASGLMPAGEHTAAWDGRDDNGCRAPTGMYYYRLVTREGTFEKRMVLLP